MRNQNVLRPVVLMLVALAFGYAAIGYDIGTLSRPGPGQFPLLIATLLFAIAVVGLVKSRYIESQPVVVNYRNLTVVLIALLGFALISVELNMVLAIVYLVFVLATVASTKNHLRSVKITIGFVIVAYAFKYLLGLQLPLM